MSKILGLDLGTKTLGMALSNEAQTLAVSYLTFTFAQGNYQAARAKVHEVINDEKINTVVLGLPINVDGRIGQRVNSVKRFAADLAKENNITIIFQDERYSTLEARERLVALGYKKEQIKAKIDQEAAQIILQTYLNKKE